MIKGSDVIEFIKKNSLENSLCFGYEGENEGLSFYIVENDKKVGHAFLSTRDGSFEMNYFDKTYGWKK